MTTNQKIDGVPRELLEQLVDPVNHIGRVKARAQLRALLDAPAEEQQWVSIEAFNRLSTELEELKAAQSQGEPVGFRYRASGGPWELMDESPFADGRTHHRENGEELQPVYAEQPAPVAVVPDGFMVVERGIWTEDQVESAAKCITMLKVVPGMTDRDLAMAAMDAGQCKAPEIALADFSCLDELKRLNTTRPAHATPPPGTEPCGTHHDNDGLDDWRKP